MSNYGNDSITKVTDLEIARMRPATYLGTNDKRGAFQTIVEVFDNGVDEFKAGYGDIIEVTLYKDGSISVQDYGRGCPVDWNPKEEKYNYELIFETLNAGGKYDSVDYSNSKGLNGVGTAVSQFTSKWMNVIVKRDSYEYTLNFKKGKIDKKNKKKTTSQETGTFIHWLPDLEVFNEIDIDVVKLMDILQRQAIINKKLKIILKIEEKNKTIEYFYENGIVDYIKQATKKPISEVTRFIGKDRGKDREDKPEYDVEMEIAFCFDQDNNFIDYYHNSSWLIEGGAPEDAVKHAFTYAVDKYLSDNNLYKSKEKKVTFDDIKPNLMLITNTFSEANLVSYSNQTKFAINNRFVELAIREFIKEQLKFYFIENKQETLKIMEKILINKRVRERMETDMSRITKSVTKKVSIFNDVNGFTDCKNREELYICEGQSAKGSIVQARDRLFQAVIAVRGKTINCLTKNLKEIFNNDIVKDLIRVIGCGVEIKSKYNKDASNFDLNKLEWDKIILATDNDRDGFHIRCLVLTMIYRLMPTLINEGKIYIVETPLYENLISIDDFKNNKELLKEYNHWIIKEDKQVSIFAYEELEQDKIIKILNDNSIVCKVNRSKGLGENDSDFMGHTAMNPTTRRLIRVVPDDVKAMAQIFDTLLGKEVGRRRKYIYENSHIYIDYSLI